MHVYSCSNIVTVRFVSLVFQYRLEFLPSGALRRRHRGTGRPCRSSRRRGTASVSLLFIIIIIIFFFFARFDENPCLCPHTTAAVDAGRRSPLRDRRQIVVRPGIGLPELVASRRVQRPGVRANVTRTKGEARRVLSKHGIRDGHVRRRGQRRRGEFGRHFQATADVRCVRACVL